MIERIAAIVRADVMIRFRRFSTLVIFLLLSASALLWVPDLKTGRTLISIGGHRALYNSGSIGMATAMLAAMFVGLFGFYVVSNAVRRDVISRCGFVAASEDVIDYLRHYSRPLMFTAALPPANTAGVLAALHVLRREPERREQLWANTRRLQEGLRSLGFEIGPTETPIVPFLIGDFEKTLTFWRKLFDAGVFTNPVVPPAVPPSPSRLRTSVMATHTADQLDFALETFGRLGKELGVI